MWGSLSLHTLVVVLVILLNGDTVFITADKCRFLSPASQDYLKRHFSVDAKSQWIVRNSQTTSGYNGFTKSENERNCNIRNLRYEEIAKCLTKKKILFFGDSMTRDIGMSLVLFLNQESNSLAGKHVQIAKDAHDICVCSDQTDKRKYYHIVGNRAARNMYHQNERTCALALSYLASNDTMSWRIDIAYEGSYNSPFSWSKLEAMHALFSYDLIILGNHGFHGIQDNIPKYSKRFMAPLLHYTNSLIINNATSFQKDTFATISEAPPFDHTNGVNKTMMPYLYLFANTNYDELKWPGVKSFRQASLVEHINLVSRDFLNKHSLPYFDNLFVAGFKEASADGVHLHKWANLIQVKLLMHFTCSDAFEFRNNAIFASTDIKSDDTLSFSSFPITPCASSSGERLCIRINGFILIALLLLFFLK